MTKWQWIKWQSGNIRRHWRLYAVIALLGYVCYRLFVANYAVISPIVRKDAANQAISDHNELVVCNAQLNALEQSNVQAGLPADISAGNKQALQHWNDPVQ